MVNEREDKSISKEKTVPLEKGEPTPGGGRNLWTRGYRTAQIGNEPRATNVKKI